MSLVPGRKLLHYEIVEQTGEPRDENAVPDGVIIVENWLAALTK